MRMGLVCSCIQSMTSGVHGAHINNVQLHVQFAKRIPKNDFVCKTILNFNIKAKPKNEFKRRNTSMRLTHGPASNMMLCILYAVSWTDPTVKRIRKKITTANGTSEDWQLMQKKSPNPCSHTIHNTNADIQQETDGQQTYKIIICVPLYRDWNILKKKCQNLACTTTAATERQKRAHRCRYTITNVEKVYEIRPILIIFPSFSPWKRFFCCCCCLRCCMLP